MAEERQETRAQEVARVRGYLARQSMQRTPVQIVEALREAHQQFLTATAAVSDGDFSIVPEQGEWSATNVLAHVCAVAAFETQTICAAIERGEQPLDVDAMPSSSFHQRTREQMLADLERSREQLFASVLKTDPEAHLDITWGHDEFGKMHWREWLLFARVHELDHARQMQAIASAFRPQGENV